MQPIAFLDLETTGLDVVEDRIVQLAITKVNPETWAVIESKLTYINPGRPIPAAATEVHGITNEIVKDAPRFEQLARGIFAFLEGANIGGYNIISFDVPILAEAFARAKLDWPAAGTLFYDAYKIFAEKEKRDLSGAVKFYLDRDHSEAHDAHADVMATIEVLMKQINFYPDLKEMDGRQLSEFCTGTNNVDLAGKIVLNADGVAVYNFGKDKGKSVKDFPGFGNWMLKENFPTNTKNVVRGLIGK